MSKSRWFLLLGVIVLTLSLVGIALAGDTAPGTNGSRSGTTDSTPPVEYVSPEDFSEGFEDITVLPDWFMQNNSNPPGIIGWFQGNTTVFSAQAGTPASYIGANYNNTSGVGTISNWLLTPTQALANGAVFKFWTRTATGSLWPDRLEVRLSLAGTSTNVGTGSGDVGDFTTLLLSVNPDLVVGGYPEVWTQYTITLTGIPGASSGRFGFRYYVTDGGSGSNSNYIGIDTVEFSSPAAGPDIAVDPTSLSQVQPPDTQNTQTLEICNVGSEDLTWELTEVPETLGGQFIPVSVEAKSTILPEGLTVSSGNTAVVTPYTPASTNAVLWDQPLSSVNQNAYVDQDFNDFPTYSSFLADDFVNGEAWSIGTIFIPGNGWNGFTTLMNASALTWQIYADNAGVPVGNPAGGGTPPVWTLTLAPTNPQVTISAGTGGFPSNTTLTLTTPVALPAGHWWLVFYPTMPFSSGQYGRQPSDTTNGYTTQFINPGGGFGLGTAWQNWSAVGATQQDMAFRLESGGPVVGIPWLSENPTSGTIPNGECQDVDVTFDSTGLAEDTYLGDLVIASNDPDEPEVDVPVSLTVGEAACTTITQKFETWPPEGWEIINDGGTCVWESTATTGYTNNTGGTGEAADANSDWCGTTMDTELRSPVFSLEDAIDPTVSYRYDYNSFSGFESGTVDISLNEGDTWTNLVTYVADNRGPAQNFVDLSAYAGEPSVMLRFGYWNADYDWWFEVDDVAYVDCNPQFPDIEVTPTELTATQFPDTITTQSLEVCNNGTADLAWDLTEVPGMKVTGLSNDSVSLPSAPRPVELTVGSVPASGMQANVPQVPDAAVSLVLDDNSPDNYIGLNDGTYGFQFIWLNRFTPNPADFPFNLTQIQVVLGSTEVSVGDPIELAVYEDTDGDNDPSNATLLASYNVTVQYNDGLTWSVYTLPSPLLLTGPGDVLIGVINRYEVSGVDPADFPAAIDQTGSQLRSWVGAWSLDPPEPPILPPDAGGLWGLIDDYFPGNWMIRGYGETAAADIPWLDEDPTSGVVSPGNCTTIDVSFDSAGLDPDTYNGILNVNSNDPDTAVVPVDVVLNVVAAPDITVEPPTLSAVLPPNATETKALEICNVAEVGGETLNWDMAEIAYPLEGVKAVLYDNGPLVTHPGGGAGGLDASALQTSLGMTIYGFGHALSSGYRVTDDFTVTDPGGWQVDQITFYAYQSFSGTTCTINNINYQIWDGPPDDPGSLVVFGDTTTNRFVSCGFSDIYRVLDTGLTNADRPIMEDVASAGFVLPPGTYWIDWQTGGTLASGPWVPPVTVLGQTTTGNAMQYDLVSWNPLIDIGQQDLPFTIVGEFAFDLPWLSENPVSGSLAPGECDTVDVAFNSTGLAPDTYTGALQIASNDPDTPSVVVPVTLTVGIPTIVTPATLTLTLKPGEIGQLPFTIGNTGTGNLVWSLSDNGTWLSILPVSGTTVPGGTSNLTATFDTAGLAPATYTAKITITSNAPTSPTGIEVTLVVEPYSFFLPFLHK